jgi:hypothetical protein
MTAITLVGQVTDALGHSEHRTLGWDGRTATETRRYSSLPALEFRSIQPAHIEVNLRHQGPAIGEVVHLERTADNSIYAVAVVSGHPELVSPTIPPQYWSGEVTATADRRDIELTGLGIVEAPAIRGLRPLEVLCGDVRDVAWRQTWHNRTPRRELLERAAATLQRRRTGDPIRITEPVQPPTPLGAGAYLDHRGDMVPTAASGRTITLPDGSVAELRYGRGTILAVR